MDEEEFAEFLAFCSENSGNALRLAFTYTKDTGDVLYVRQDVEKEHIDSGFATLRESAWEVHETVFEEEAYVDTVGDYRVTIHMFDNVFVMQFRIDEKRGVAVSFDREVGPNLHSFLEECEKHL